MYSLYDMRQGVFKTLTDTEAVEVIQMNRMHFTLKGIWENTKGDLLLWFKGGQK